MVLKQAKQMEGMGTALKNLTDLVVSKNAEITRQAVKLENQQIQMTAMLTNISDSKAEMTKGRLKTTTCPTICNCRFPLGTNTKLRIIVSS